MAALCTPGSVRAASTTPPLPALSIFLLSCLERSFRISFAVSLPSFTARRCAANQPLQLPTRLCSASFTLLHLVPLLLLAILSLSPSLFLSPSPSLSRARARSPRTLYRVYERTSLNKLLFIRPVAEMNLRDSYRTRPDMHDGFESLSFPPNVFSEVIDRRPNVPRNTRCLFDRGACEK